MNTHKVAAIIPCFNSARFLPAAISSALQQSYKLIDVIVIDDGSTDQFREAVKPYLEDIILIEQAHLGPSQARNQAINSTNAQYIAFLDSDDIWHKEKISRQVQLLEENSGCLLVHTGVQPIDAQGNKLQNENTSEQLAVNSCLQSLVAHNSIITSSVLVRRSVFQTEKFDTELSFAEDWDLWIRLAAKGFFGYIPEKLTGYRKHSTNISKDYARMTSAVVTVLQRVLECNYPKPVCDIAHRGLRESILRLAHVEYERQRYGAARTLFLKAFPTYSKPDFIRIVATFLPDRMRSPLRRIWNRASLL
jgi:glycosyltransferase involved in cell wall biosynthesis